MQYWFREHQILKKVLVVQLPRDLEFLEVLILLRKTTEMKLHITTMAATKAVTVMDIFQHNTTTECHVKQNAVKRTDSPAESKTNQGQ